MTEEEGETNEEDTIQGGKADFISDDAMSFDDDPEVSDKEEGMSFSFGGSRGFEE